MRSLIIQWFWTLRVAGSSSNVLRMLLRNEVIQGRKAKLKSTLQCIKYLKKPYLLEFLPQNSIMIIYTYLKPSSPHLHTVVENHPKSIIFSDFQTRRKMKKKMFSNLGSWKTKKLIRNQVCMTSFRIFQKFYNVESWNDFRYRYDCILRCDIVSIFQLEGSLEYQFAVLRMIPKKITFLVILWFGIF